MIGVQQLRAWQCQRIVSARRALHERPYDASSRSAAQLEQFHRQWHEIRRNVPYYAELSRQWPHRFASWDEVLERVPVCRRSTIQEQAGRMHDPRRPAQWQRITGGSTSQPVQLPAWHSENRYTNADVWMARGWYGVTPADRLFLLWGHSHLLGVGLSGRWKAWQRQLKDRLLGYHRFSAYDLSEPALRRGGDELVRSRPGYVIGYSVALDRMARFNRDRRDELRSLGVKVVIGCAEAFPAADSVDLLADLFDAPVAMEYGSVETGLVAHTRPIGGYDVFWNSYYVEAGERGPNGGRTIRVTSLYPRCLPLIRYELGDEIVVGDDEPLPGVAHFSAVQGRCHAFVELPDGTQIHSEAITHCVRACRAITSYQAVQTDDAIELRVTAEAEIPGEEHREIRHRLTMVHPLLERVTIRRVDQLEQSLAGKTPMIVRRTSATRSNASS